MKVDSIVIFLIMCFIISLIFNFLQKKEKNLLLIKLKGLRETNAEINKAKDELKERIKGITAEQHKMKEDIGGLLNAVEQFSSGSLQTRSKITTTSDEIKRLNKGINSLFESIIDLIRQIDDASQTLSSSASGILNNSKRQSAVINEIASQISTSTTSVRELASSSQKIAENASHIYQLSEKAADMLNYTMGAVSETNRGIDDIRIAIESTAKKLTGLGENLKEINDVIKILNDIADQTDLLSMNASIEAAKAGELGQGFVNIAFDISRFASRSNKANANVNNLAANILTMSSITTEAMRDTIKSVEKSIIQATKSTEKLQQVIESIKYMAVMIKGITSTSQQQNNNSSQFVEYIGKINETITQTAASTNQTLQAARELAEYANSLKEQVALVQG